MATTYLLAIAPDRVDLAVVGDGTERLGQPPHRMRVGRIPLVEEGIRNDPAGRQIREQLSQPPAGDQALIDDGPRGRGRNRELVEPRRDRAHLDPPPREDQSPFEGRRGQALGPEDDRLVEARHRRQRLRPQRRRVVRHPAPALDRQTFRRQPRCHERTGPQEPAPAPGQEELDDPRTQPLQAWRQRRDHGLRHWQRHPRPVARLAVGGERPAVGQRPEPREGERQHPIPRPTAGVRHEPDPARIVLIPGVVERRLGQSAHSRLQAVERRRASRGEVRDSLAVCFGVGRPLPAPGRRGIRVGRRPPRGRRGRARPPRRGSGPAGRAGSRRA